MSRALVCAAALVAVSPAEAAKSGWQFNFQQGSAEYSVGNFGDRGNNVALYCSEAGPTPGSASVFVHRFGFKPSAPTPTSFTTETGTLTMTLDSSNSISFQTPQAPEFRRLWRLITTGKTLRVSFGPGAPLVFPLAGARALLGPQVCPKQLAGN